MQPTTDYSHCTQLDLWAPPEAAPAPAKKRRRTQEQAVKPVPAASGSGAAILAIADQLDAIAESYMSLEDPIYDQVGGCGMCSTSCFDRDEVCEVCAEAWAINDAAVEARNAWARHCDYAECARQAATWANGLPEADAELLRAATARLADSLTRRDKGWLAVWPALEGPREVAVLIKCIPHLISLPVDESSALDLFDAPEADSPLNEQELAVLRTRARRLFDLPIDDCVVPTGVFARSWEVTGHDDADVWVLMDREFALAVQAARRGLPTVDLGAESDDGGADDPRYVREILVELGVLRSR